MTLVFAKMLTWYSSPSFGLNTSGVGPIVHPCPRHSMRRRQHPHTSCFEDATPDIVLDEYVAIGDTSFFNRKR